MSDITQVYAGLYRNAEEEVSAVHRLIDHWEHELGEGRCPSCQASLQGMSTCDHEEGYHHALSDLRAVLAHERDQDPT